MIRIALGLAVFAAMALLVASEGWWRRPGSTVARFDEHGAYSLAREWIHGGTIDPRKAAMEFNGAMGNECYVGHRYSLDTEQLTASYATSRELGRLEVRDENADRKIKNTDFSHEQIQLKDCLA